MDHHRTRVPVLARFPDLNDCESDANRHKTSGLALLAAGGRLIIQTLSMATRNRAASFGLLASSGRLISQTMSIKLLAGTALFLMVGAVLPFCIGKNPPPADSSPGIDSPVTAQSGSANATAEDASAADEAVALTASRPTVRLIAATGPSPAPAMLPASSEIPGRPQAGPPNDEPQMSRWPSPAPTDLQPTGVGGAVSPAGVYGPAATRPTEYQADAGSAPGNNREPRR